MATIAINGFGRIGRACARMILKSRIHKLIAINDLADRETLVYLFKYDSVYGRFEADLSAVRFSNAAAPRECDFSGADTVLDCTGAFTKYETLEGYVKNGAKRVVISTPIADVRAPTSPPLTEPTAPIVSAGSCTANALYLISKRLDERFGVEAVLATSIHSYTSDQRILDGRNDERRRGRASAINIIPVATSAAKNLIGYDAYYADKAAAIGLRIPTPNVSMMQATFLLKNPANRDEINFVYERSQNSALAVTKEPKVSTDIIGLTASAIVDTSLTLSCGALACVCAWHDNETGFAARMLELVSA